jgi:hypothetical protein
MARFRFREEAAGWAAEIVDAARRVRHRRLAVLLTWAASSAWGVARLEEARRHGEEAISLAGNPAFDPFMCAYGDLAFVVSYGGDVERALTLVRTGAVLRAAPADDRGMPDQHRAANLRETRQGVTDRSPTGRRSAHIASGKRTINPSRFGIFTLGKVSAFMVSFSPMSLFCAKM